MYLNLYIIFYTRHDILVFTYIKCNNYYFQRFFGWFYLFAVIQYLSYPFFQDTDGHWTFHSRDNFKKNRGNRQLLA